jgi:two-component system, sensor histidine kinase and response regulator
MKTSHKGTLLIVDDVPTNLKVLFTYLREFGFDLRIAEDGEDALKQISYTKPDLILLDVMMPGIDGFETCRRLKANEETREIPVIFMTALTDTVDKIKGFQMGAVDYISKPVQHEEVLARVTTHLTLRNQQRMLEKQNCELEAFAHTVAHDLKNPLSAISTITDLLVHEGNNLSIPNSLNHLKIIEHATTKTFSIINSLLLLSSVRSQTVQMTALNMADIITQVQHQIAHTMEKYQGEMSIPNQWPIAQGHAPWIEEVWTNYIINGLKYGGKPPRLELGATSLDNGCIRFWVHDNGPGLTEEEQNHLFIPFTRISQARIEGHGLGLSIVQRIIEKCGGQVGVDSKIGQGSTFYFTLPAIIRS